MTVINVLTNGITGGLLVGYNIQSMPIWCKVTCISGDWYWLHNHICSIHFYDPPNYFCDRTVSGTHDIVYVNVASALYNLYSCIISNLLCTIYLATAAQCGRCCATNISRCTILVVLNKRIASKQHKWASVLNPPYSVHVQTWHIHGTASTNAWRLRYPLTNI